MKRFNFSNPDLRIQFFVSISVTLLVSTGCYFISDYIGYRVVALLLMVTVSITAIFYDIKPVATVAILSALIWNFLFIPPRFQFSINNAEDLLMFLMYFLIALVNAVLITRIRKAEREANRKREKENVIKLYNTLLNSLSHELRTPISTIIGAADNLQSMSDKLSEFNKYELLAEISKASFLLNRQVENLLNMSRLESGYLQAKLDWVDLKELVHDVINQLKDISAGKPIQVLVDEHLPLVKTDYGLLFQVVHNLLHNAITYISKYAVIFVKIVPKNTGVIIYIEDTGSGFPENEIDRVFDKFYRLKNSGTGGTGLGLSIVKGFVAALGGQITLTNITPTGARFTIVLPSELSNVTVEKA